MSFNTVRSLARVATSSHLIRRMTTTTTTTGSSIKIMTSPTATGAGIRCFSSFGEESPLEQLLDPHAPTPLFGRTEYEPQPATTKKLECGLDESSLRFKTKSYGRLLQPPYVHPNEHKIVMTVPLADLELSSLERDILKEIVGAGRWHEDKGQLRMQSVAFGSRIENKRHLVSMLDRLVLACRRLAAEVSNNNNSSNQGTHEEAA